MSEKDKKELSSYMSNKNCNIFLALLCGCKNLNESEIAILDKDKIKEIIDLSKTSITISRIKGEHEFRIPRAEGETIL